MGEDEKRGWERMRRRDDFVEKIHLCTEYVCGLL
jgi:hypothetical protein